MFKKSFLFTLLSLSFAPTVWAEENTQSAQFDVSGALRFSYTHNDYLADAGNKIDFADAVLWLNYKKDQWTGHLDYRAYESNNKLGGLHFPLEAWLAYDVTPDQQVKVGLQSVPIGLGRFQGSTYNLTQLYNLGLEDVHQWGISYSYSPEDYQLNLAYFLQDAGSYTGKSRHSAHYSAHPTAENGVDGTSLEEKHSFAARLAKDFQYEVANTPITTKIGTSYLYSQIDNLDTNQSGDRQVWSVFHNTKVQDVGLNLIYGGQRIDHKDQRYPHTSTFGAFDGAYQVANNGHFLATEINYSVPFETKDWSRPLLYSSYSRFFKDHAGYQDSERWINGIYTTYKKNFQFYLEHISGKNDQGLGANNGYADGKSKEWNSLLYLSLGYYF